MNTNHVESRPKTPHARRGLAPLRGRVVGRGACRHPCHGGLGEATKGARRLHRGSAAGAGRVAVADVCRGVRVSTHPHGHGPRDGLGPPLVHDHRRGGSGEHEEKDQDDDARGAVGRTIGVVRGEAPGHASREEWQRRRRLRCGRRCGHGARHALVHVIVAVHVRAGAVAPSGSGRRVGHLAVVNVHVGVALAVSLAELAQLHRVARDHRRQRVGGRALAVRDGLEAVAAAEAGVLALVVLWAGAPMAPVYRVVGAVCGAPTHAVWIDGQTV
mmetsp:Transcript_4518/g.10246  ORF Transcript_4518/g.10246 Transcript_4518/m.10246 type:complete len:272 (-) Transcript_4518:272-1087(-)